MLSPERLQFDSPPPSTEIPDSDHCTKSCCYPGRYTTSYAGNTEASKETPFFLNSLDGGSGGYVRLSFLNFDYCPLEFPRRGGNDGQDNWEEIGYADRPTLIANSPYAKNAIKKLKPGEIFSKGESSVPSRDSKLSSTESVDLPLASVQSSTTSQSGSNIGKATQDAECRWDTDDEGAPDDTELDVGTNVQEDSSEDEAGNVSQVVQEPVAEAGEKSNWDEPDHHAKSGRTKPAWATQKQKVVAKAPTKSAWDQHDDRKPIKAQVRFAESPQQAKGVPDAHPAGRPIPRTRSAKKWVEPTSWGSNAASSEWKDGSEEADESETVDEQDNRKTVWIQHVPSSTPSKAVFDVFRPFGKINSVRKSEHRHDPASSFVFVDFTTHEDAAKAVDHDWTGTRHFGKDRGLRVEWCEQTSKQREPDRKVMQWEREAGRR
ncbi:hypothetical protein HK097_008222 [Rhizophlyctis rosea]|uniref:RRM domain-containing protein n=1 Tax=Rhizophlyctis rosea TaxID=64517 RepID=A0AAD5SCT1_9FUNG|nr:hypothetical protein HK097_008222 [Rhizophlyctis rosea]